MQLYRLLMLISLSGPPIQVTAQSTYFMEGSKDIHTVDRLEIKQQKNATLNLSSVRPFNRQFVISAIQLLDSTGNYERRTIVDVYNLNSLLMNNSEWVTDTHKSFMAVHPVFNTFYLTKANLAEVNKRNFFLAINPVLQIQVGKESNNAALLFKNSEGINLRGMIAKKIGFAGYITANQERGPAFFKQRIDSFNAIPGVGYYGPFKKTGYQYIDARGYVTLALLNEITLQFGYDKNFIGNGYRSLFLSDWGSPYLFLKLNTRVWKFNYQNLFMKLTPQLTKPGEPKPENKYAVMHQLSINATKWLNIGFFEGIIFSRKNNFDLEYLNPVIFYRSVEGNIGSPDNAVIGFDFKANMAHRAQLYGQLLLDEFVISRLKNDPSYWANKYGYQLGVKYVDAFGITNLDVQVETNRVRPFTYSHGNNGGNYTHYNQPLAHPLGANFQEFIGIINYQPKPKWSIYTKLIYYYQGLDSAGIDFGGNPFINYLSRTKEFGFTVGSGEKANCFNGLVDLSYEWRRNLFINFSFVYRKYQVAEPVLNKKTTLFNAGIRLNISQRFYDY